MIALERVELLAQVASMYYDENCTQDEIAHRFRISRSTVSRLLRQARDEGVVEITVHRPWAGDQTVAHNLISTFDLRAASVFQKGNLSAGETLRGVGRLAARYLQSVLADEIKLAISWGSAVHNTVRALRPVPLSGVSVTQMVGAVGVGDVSIDGPELVRTLAGLLGGSFRYLHAPLIVKDVHARDILLQQPNIADTLARICEADIALVGIGTPRPEGNSLLRAGYVDIETLTDLRRAGAVGDVCARHYDLNGCELDLDLNHRVVGIEIEALRGIDRVIGVTGGDGRAAAVLGAIRGRYVNVLVTDDETAENVLALAQVKG
jgi:deoxyribonucleoside regulator